MNNSIIAQRLKDAMAIAQINANELSRLSGVSKASISQYVNGTHSPSQVNSRKIAAALEINSAWLMGYDVPKYARPQQDPSVPADEEAMQIAQKIYDNNELCSLFREAMIATPEHLQIALMVLRALNHKTEPLPGI